MSGGSAVGRIPQLDGLRALAVALVVVDHCVPWFPGGGVGVNIFFVLSGYLITSLLLGERESTGGIRLGMFYARRALRLYPALVVMLAVTAVAGGVALSSVLIAGTYTTNLFMTLGLRDVSPYGHTWSLALEEQFYLIWPLLLPLAARLGRRIAVFALVVLAVASATWAQLSVAQVIDSNGSLTVGVFNPLWQAHGLLLGCAVAIAIRHRPVRVPAVLAHVGIAVCLVVALAASVTVQRHWAAGWNLVSEFGAAAAIAGLRDGSPGAGRLLLWRPVQWAGTRSYAIYLWHLPLIIFAGRLGYGLPGALVAVAVALIAAALSWRFVERPFLRLKRRFEPRTAPQVEALDAGTGTGEPARPRRTPTAEPALEPRT